MRRDEVIRIADLILGIDDFEAAQSFVKEFEHIVLSRVRISIPTETMEAEFGAHFRRGMSRGYEQGAKTEREACAKLCDEADKSTHPSDLADRIRARGRP